MPGCWSRTLAELVEIGVTEVRRGREVYEAPMIRGIRVELEAIPQLSATTTQRPAVRLRLKTRKAAPRRDWRLSWRARGVLACGLAVLGIVGWALLARAVAPHENTSLDKFDVLIVLGYPADADGNPSPTEQARVTEAVQEYYRGVAPRMILTGAAARNQFVEARVMARTAEAQGIPSSAIVEEMHAMNTIENACDSVQLMRSHGWESAEVVTSASHIPRAAMIFNGLPLKWRMHAAPPLGSEPSWMAVGRTTMEIVKTIHYLVWSRQAEPCRIGGQ